MNKQLHHNAAMYSPMEFKTFAGALGAFFSQECPQLGGERTRRVLVQSVVGMVERFYPETTHLRPGQIQWTTVHKDEKTSHAKKITNTRLTSVVLDLVRLEDAADRAKGKSLRDMKKEAVARLFTQAYEQDGCMTNAEVAILLKMCGHTVTKYAREWETEHNRLLPRRGTIHDLGRTLTHKEAIVRRLVLEGKSVQQVCRETYHSPEAVHRYITRFKQVMLCRGKGLSSDETAYVIHASRPLVEEYNKLLDEMWNDNHALRRLIELDGKEGSA